MKAIEIEQFGGPEVLQLVDRPTPVAGPGAKLIEVSRAGINYADTHQAENTYLTPATLPLTPGGEVVGRTTDGRRVVALLPSGGYAEFAVAPDNLIFDVPDGVEDGQALALVLQGVTAWHLLRTSARLAAGETVVVHAGAGGVGLLAVQLARLFGAGRVIATASTADKRALAVEHGADIAIEADPPTLRDRLMEVNDDRKVDVILEMTGGPVFDQSLRALAPFGRLVVFGQASRVPASPIDPVMLMATSRAVIGFWLGHGFARPAELIGAPLRELFDLVAEGKLRTVTGGEYPLSEVRQAHEDLRARRTVGKLLLDPHR
ncbi:MAG TPA: zinc-binding dehydrogenase [Pseudonocardiaceae bacterium]|nr:zinc-binding dehydrogenase [Pseudonocardiaceae bacterium]